MSMFYTIIHYETDKNNRGGAYFMNHSSNEVPI